MVELHSIRTFKEKNQQLIEARFKDKSDDTYDKSFTVAGDTLSDAFKGLVYGINSALVRGSDGK